LTITESWTSSDYPFFCTNNNYIKCAENNIFFWSFPKVQSYQDNFCSNYFSCVYYFYHYYSYDLFRPFYDWNLESDPFWTCKQIESSDHFLLKCPMYSHLRNIIFINISGQQNSDNLLIGSSNITPATIRSRPRRPQRY
jgi:hypothetical protein